MHSPWGFPLENFVGSLDLEPQDDGLTDSTGRGTQSKNDTTLCVLVTRTNIKDIKDIVKSLLFRIAKHHGEILAEQ